MHPKNNSGGSPGSEHTESGGESPLVSVKYSERGRLPVSVTTRQPGKPYENVVCVKIFVVYGCLLHNNKTSVWGDAGC